MLLHTKYQGSRFRGFRQEDLFIFPLYKPMLKCDPQGRPMFGPQEHNFNKLGSGLLDDATY